MRALATSAITSDIRIKRVVFDAFGGADENHLGLSSGSICDEHLPVNVRRNGHDHDLAPARTSLHGVADVDAIPGSGWTGDRSDSRALRSLSRPGTVRRPRAGHRASARAMVIASAVPQPPAPMIAIGEFIAILEQDTPSASRRPRRRFQCALERERRGPR